METLLDMFRKDGRETDVFMVMQIMRYFNVQNCHFPLLVIESCKWSV